MLVKKFFLDINYRRVTTYTLVTYTILGCLFKINILQPYSGYKMIFAVVAILSFYFLINEKKDDFLFVTILYVLLQPVLDYLITIANIDLNVLLMAIAILIAVSWRIDSINKINTEVDNSRSSIDYFNLVYLNSAKSYEIATLIDDTIKTTIQKENSNIISRKNSFKIGMKNSFYSGYENDNELTAESKINESFEVKSTKSTIFRKVYEMSKNFQAENLEQGDLIKFDSVALNPVNAQDIPLILQVLQASKLDNPSTEGIELNMSNLLSTFLTDYTIDYSFQQDGEEFLVRFPYGDVEGFENGYRHSDFQLGKLSLVGIDRGKVDFSEVDTISTRFLEFMSKQANKNNVIKNVKDIIPKSSLSEKSDKSGAEFEIDFKYEKLKGTYHLIDVIAVVQKINVESES